MLNYKIFKIGINCTNEETKVLVNKFNLQLENEGIKINESYNAIDQEIKKPSVNAMETIRNGNDSITAGYIAILRLLEWKRDIIIPLLKKEMESEKKSLELKREEIKKKIRDGYKALYNDRLDIPDERPFGVGNPWFDEYNKSKEYNAIKQSISTFGSSVATLENPVKSQIEKVREVIRNNICATMKGQIKSFELNLDGFGILTNNNKIEVY